MIARTDVGKLVAAGRVLLAAGWDVDHRKGWGMSRYLLGPAIDGQTRQAVMITPIENGQRVLLQEFDVRLNVWLKLVDVHVTTVSAAIDHLVVAGILPAEHASWTPLQVCGLCGLRLPGHTGAQCRAATPPRIVGHRRNDPAVLAALHGVVPLGGRL